MARIPDEVVDRVRDAADLLEIVQESVQLKRTGADYRGPCPFHGGTNRNFAVIPRKNLYYCFVCHAAGDVFSWYRERFGLDYPSAVREVARRYGIVVPEASENVGPDPREPLFSACDAAHQWFVKQLREAPDGEDARRYLQRRGFTEDAAGEFGLGWSPRRGDAFIAAMRELGIAEATLVEASLLIRRDDGTVVPRFRGRLIFPIHDGRGRVVAFGGRVIGDGEPKYLNSSDSPVFHKGEQLYHLHVARNVIRKAEVAWLVEGYFDVLRLSLAGIDHVVAPLGTALTEQQAVLLKRFTTEVVILYDSDGPGLKSSFRAADLMLAAGLRVRIATMPPGDDPDTIVQRDGVAAVNKVVDDSLDVLERKLQLLERGGWFSDLHRSRAALDRLTSTLRAAADPVTREIYLSRVAERLSIPRDAVAEEVARTRRSAPVTPVRGPVPVEHRPERRPSRSYERAGADPVAKVEASLLRLILAEPVWLARARDDIETDWFLVPTFREIFAALQGLPDGAPASEALEQLSERGREAWSRLASEPVAAGYDSDAEYAGALDYLQQRPEFAAIVAEPDPAVRLRRRAALTAENRTRFNYYLKARQRLGLSRLSPPEE